jgi:hypothetical protein
LGRSFYVVVRRRSSFVVLIGVASAAQVGVSTNPPVMRVVVWVLTFLCSLLSPLVVRWRPLLLMLLLLLVVVVMSWVVVVSADGDGGGGWYLPRGVVVARVCRRRRRR